ncbi:MAG: helix-turn-helix domain-containing protein [Alphaproteobacteria bacterium]
MSNHPAQSNVPQDTLEKSVERHMRQYFAAHSAGGLPPSGLYWRTLPLFERPLLEIALQATGYNQIKAARLLGINRNTLRKKITELNIVMPDNK